MMRTLITIGLLLTFLIPNAQDKFSIVASCSMIADMASEIAGEHAEIKSIVPIGGDPHIYDPTPTAAKLTADADLIFVNGLTFEGWINELIENSGTDAKTITVTEGIQAIGSEKYQNATDPHAWMSAKLGQQYILNIKNALVEHAPQYRATFEENYNRYSKDLEALDIEIEQAIASIPQNKRILITSHDAFQYYGRRYGIQLESILGVSTDADVQTSDVIRLNKIIRESQVPAVFIESTINPKLIQQIATDNKVVIGGKLYADSLGDKDSPAPTYLAMLKHNTDVIVAALSKDRPVVSSMERDSGKPIWMYIVGAITLIGLIALIIAKRQHPS